MNITIERSVDKDPQATLDYGFTWVDWMDEGDSITASTWAITGPDSVLAVTTPAPSFDAVSTTVWLNGGTLGKAYYVTNHITTLEGRQDDRTFIVYVKNL